MANGIFVPDIRPVNLGAFGAGIEQSQRIQAKGQVIDENEQLVLRRQQASELISSGDTENFKKAVLLDPDFAKRVSQGFGIQTETQEKELKNDLITASAFLSSDDIETADAILANRQQRLVQQGRNPGNTVSIRDLLSKDPVAAKKVIDALASQSTLGKGNVSIVSGSTELVTVPVLDDNNEPVLNPDGSQKRQFANTFTTFDKVTQETRQVTTELGQGAEVFIETPEQKAERTTEQLKEKTDEEIRREREKAAIQKETARDIKKEEAAGTGIAKRELDVVSRGLSAADALPVISRGLQLLDAVKTGGFSRVSLAAKRLFGVESADEAELSTNLGKAVLSQLRTTFGAAFTEKEGKRLEDIEAGFGKSTAGNRRLLEQTKAILNAAIRRGKRAAERQGDSAALEDFDELGSFTLDALQLEDEQQVGKFKIRVKQ